MNLMKNINVKKISSIAFGLVGLLGGILTIISFFTDQTKIDLRYEIISNTSVLDIKEEVGNLEILYNGKSLQKTKENLRVILLKISNAGNAPILKDYFDDADPVGFSVRNGTILETPNLTGQLEQYFYSNLQLYKSPNGKITFSKVIINPGEFFVIKILILHNNANIPEIIPCGKVAWQKNIIVEAVDNSKENISIMDKVFYGDVLIHFVRAFLYILVIIISILFAVFVGFQIEGVKEKLDRRKREKIVKNFKELDRTTASILSESFFGDYIHDKNKNFSIALLSEFLKEEEERLNICYVNAMEKEKAKQKLTRVDRLELFGEDGKIDFENHSSLAYDCVEKLLEHGVLLKTGERLSINQKAKEALLAFSNFAIEKE